MHAAMTRTEHRAWPYPEAAWSWRQSWNDLLFIHYRVDTRAIAHLVPKPLAIEEFDGSSWIGVVPFDMNGVMRRPFPNVPWFSNFLELNVRLYVVHQGRPGVWFLSLDATNPLVVWGGNQFFNLPYRHARIHKTMSEGWTRFHSVRKDTTRAELDVRHRPTGEVFYAKPGTLEHFLTERYCFYASSPHLLMRAEVHHWPWPLQPAEAEITKNTLLEGIEYDRGTPPLFHYSKGVDVVSWNPKAT